MMGAHAHRHIELPFRARDGNHRVRPGQHGELRVQQAGGALTDHHHRIARLNAQPVLCMFYRRQRFDNGGIVERQISGQGMGILARQMYQLRQRAIDFAPEQSGIAAKVLHLAPAHIAVAAGNDRVDDDGITRFDVHHLFACRFHHTGGFMPHHHRVFQVGVEAFVDAQIGVTHRRGSNTHHHMIGRQGRNCAVNNRKRPRCRERRGL